MSVSERKLKNSLTQATYYYKNRNTDYTFKDKATDIIKKLYKPFETNLTQTLQESSTESIVQLAEAAHLVNLFPISEHLILIYFELESSIGLNKNSFFIRALLVRALVEARAVEAKSLRAEDSIAVLKTAISSVQKALDISVKPENKAKYASLTYNASLITFNMLKKYLKINWAKNFWEILEKLSLMLEEADDVDFNWRIIILIKLAQAYIDADKKPEGSKALDKIADILKKKGECNFQEELYRIRIHLSRDNNAALGNIKKEGEMAGANYPQFKYLYTVQCIKSNVIQEKDIDKEVNGLITAICPDFFKNLTNKAQGNNLNEINVKLEPWKADVLSELAYEILRYKLMIPMSMNLFNFLTQSGSNSLKGKIFLENIRSQKVLIDLESNLKEKVQPTDIIRQKRIDTLCESLQILERNMAGCARILDFDLINESSMLIFNTAMPFFKKSFRKHFVKVFYTSCDLLEQIESNESYLRASMHYELSKYYLEEDLLQEANSHLMKALNNDYSIPQNKVTATLNASLANTQQKDQKKPPGNAPQQGKPGTEDPNLINSISNNVSYLQRNLEQYLVYLKRYIGIKINIYDDPNTTIDKLIFECDNIKNAKNETIQVETINKCVELIKEFSLPEFVLPKSDRDFVSEEEAQMRMKHNLSLYDDKKHFILICSEIIKYCYKYDQYEAVLAIMKEITKYINDFSNTKDIDQFIVFAEANLDCAQCYIEYLLNEGIELCSYDFANFNTPTKTYVETEKDKLNEWRQGLYDSIQEGNRIGVLINQPWLLFNVAIQLWNSLVPIVRSPNFVNICNEKLFPVFADVFEALNNAMIYYESINSESTDTDYFKKLDVFIHLTEVYTKFLEAKGKQDECIRVCDVMLSRKINSNFRKIFDSIKTRALKAPTGDAGKKGAVKAPPKQPAKKEGAGAVFIPSQDMTLISDCFATLESSIITSDDKAKFDLLKKGIDQLKTYKINFNDENTIELNSELWYKFGVNFFSLNSISNNYKLALYCAENAVKTYDNVDIAKQRQEISLTLQKWYCLGFLLYGDSVMKIVDGEKQERISQIKLYFTAIDKILMCTKIAEKAKQYFVILQAIKSFYSIVINVIDQPQNREKLCPKFLELHHVLINNRAGGLTLYSDPEFLLLFFSLFCLCINETKNWELGEKIISEGIKIIPSQFHHILLENKLFYYSKQGKSFLQNLQPGGGGGAGGDKDVLTKAKLFTKLARSSKNKSDQFNAYNRAIELLKTDQNIYVCDVIFELSTWLYKNNYPFNDIEENLNQAADILLEIEQIFEDDEDLDDENHTLHSKRSSSSRKSRLSKKSKSRRSGVSSKKKTTLTNNVKSKASERSKSRNYSHVSSKTKTVFAKLLDYDPYPLFMNIQHLQHLFKIHVFLSMVSNDYIKKQEYLLDGFFVLKKILEISFKTMNCIEFYEKNKDDISNLITANEVNPLASLINNFFIAKDINITQIHTMPESLDAWLTYSFPENFINRIVQENSNNQSQTATIITQNVSLPNYTFFCRKSFEAPYQFYYYFNYMLDKFLNEYMFHSECLMMLKFALIYSKHVIGSNELEYSYMLKYQRLVYNIVIQNDTNQLSKDIFSSLKTLEQPKFTQEFKAKQREDLRKFNVNLNENNEDSFMPLPPENIDSIVVYADDLRSHIIWIELANEYYNSGYFNFAKEYAEEAVFHSLVFKDKTNYMKAKLLLAKVHFLEANFEQSTIIFNKLQSINQAPDMMFNIIITMTNIFDYMNKYEEMIVYLNGVIEYLQLSAETTSTIHSTKSDNKNMTYSSSLNIYYQMYSYALINKIRASIKKQSENIKLNEYNIAKEQKSSINNVLSFYKNEIFPQLKKYNEILRKNSNNMFNIMNEYDFIDLTLECLLKNNIFVYINKEELIVLSDILEKCLQMLEEITTYLNLLQTYIPMRIDNSIVYLPIHRLIAIARIKYGIINNLIGELKSRIKRESRLNEKLSIEDNDIDTKFAEGTKYNQEVIDYLNSLTKQISKMNSLEHRDNIENMNRYEKSISLLVSCESLILPISAEYVEYFIEKINSFRLQSLHFKELKDIWSIETYNNVKLMQSNIDNQNEESIEQNKELQKKLQIQKFHQMTINLISTFEKQIVISPQYKQILFNCNRELLKYYFNIIETSGYLNLELSYKGLVDYQNSHAKTFYSTVIKRYSNPSSRDWSTFCFNSVCKSTYSFNCQHEKIYRPVTYPESINNFTNYINEISYFKNSTESFYSNWNEVKTILPSNSSYFIFQMNEDKSILYIGLMTIKGSERAIGYYLKRIVLNSSINGVLDDMIQVIRTMKHILIKSVIVTKEELTKLFEEYNEKLTQILFKLENEIEVLKPVIQEINDIINPAIEVSENDPNVQSKKKAEAKPGAAKKDKGGNLSSDIQLPTSNIESIVFLIDHRFYELPLEQLSIFSKIPFKSNDFSLNTHIMRLKSVNYNPSMGSISLPGNVKYYIDVLQQTKVDIKNSITSKLGQSGKNQVAIEGIMSCDHKPSIAELQKLYMNSSMFFFTSQTSILYQFPFDIFDTSKYSKCKVAFVFDRIANIKNYVDQNSLIPKTFSFSYQPIDTIAMMTLCGVVSVMTTKWSIDYDEISELIDDCLDECTTKNTLLSYSIHKYITPKRALIKKEGEEEEKQQELVKGKKEVPAKKKEETIVLDETNSIEIKRLQIFNLAPVIYGLNNVKLV